MNDIIFDTFFCNIQTSNWIRKLVINDPERAKEILPNIFEDLINNNQNHEPLKVLCKTSDGKELNLEINCEFIDDNQTQETSNLYELYKNSDTFADVHSFFQINLNLDENKTN